MGGLCRRFHCLELMEKMVKLCSDRFGHGRETRLFVFFDRIQYLRDWEVHLKTLVDSFPKFHFVATGSSASALKLKSREPGAGRFTEFILPPLTIAEDSLTLHCPDVARVVCVGKEAARIEANRTCRGKLLTGVLDNGYGFV